jgi:DNA-binding transcriptional LysR family regulator
MELRHLRYFLAVAETENVRLASERLHITQPAVSRQIHELEEELGVQLFERLPRGLRLTPEGQAYRLDALEVMASLNTARDRVRGIANGETGLLRIGYVEVTAWRGVVPEALRAFRALAPGVRLELAPMFTLEQLELIKRDTLDGGFVYLFDNLPDGFVSVELPPQNVVLALPSRREKHWKKKLLLRDLADTAFVTFHRATYPAYYARLFAACAQVGLVPKVVQEGASEAAVLSLVSAGIGVAIVNNANINRPPVQVDFVKLADLDVPLSLSFVYREDHCNSALVRFVSQLVALASLSSDS